MIKCSFFILEKERWDQYGIFYPRIPTIIIRYIRNNYLSNLKTRMSFWTRVRFQPITMLFPSVEPVSLTKGYDPIFSPNINIFSENFMQLLYSHLNRLLLKIIRRNCVDFGRTPILFRSSLAVESQGAYDFVTLGCSRRTRNRNRSSDRKACVNPSLARVRPRSYRVTTEDRPGAAGHGCTGSESDCAATM